MIPRIRLHASLRHTAIRNSFFESKLHASQFVWPVFLSHRKADQIIPGGCFKEPNIQWGASGDGTYSSLRDKCSELLGKGLRHIMLFGVVSQKDHRGSLADDDMHCPVINCLKAIRSDSRLSRLSLMADVCLCEYTENGHCGITDSRGKINNSESVKRLSEVAVAYALAGADVLCPSDMMDGRIGAIRDSLNSFLSEDLSSVMLMSYSSKKASVFYSPFRSAVESSFKGERAEYQHPVGSSSIAIRAVQRDLDEGADIVLVKPALMYGDIISRFKRVEGEGVPVAAYLVSGEYQMLTRYEEEHGNLRSFHSVVREAHVSLVRAGADILVSYFTPDILENGLIDLWNQ